MEEKDVIEENITPETTGEEVVSVEETTEETVADQTEEIVSEEVEAEESGASEYVVTSNAEAQKTPKTKASKKTTAVLVTMIVVLVAVIGVVVALVCGNIKKQKEQEAKDAEIQAMLDRAAKQQEEKKAAEEKQKSEPKEEPEYHIEVTLGEYKGIEAKYSVAEVTEDEIQKEIDDFLDQNKEVVEITDRPVADGDTVNIDYFGYFDDYQFEGGTDTGFDLTIGSGKFIDGFESGLIGHEIGEAVDVYVTFPDPYIANPDYAGKDARFNVIINSISEVTIPEFTDEFVQLKAGLPSAEEFRKSIREQYEADKQEEAQSRFEALVLNEAINRCTYSGDVELRTQYYEEEIRSYNDYIGTSYYGIDGQTLFYYMYGMDADAYNQYISEQALAQTKYEAMLNEIIKAENFTVSDEEYEATFKEIFIDHYGYSDKEAVLADSTQEEIDEMVNNTILQDKAQKVIIDNAIKTE